MTSTHNSATAMSDKGGVSAVVLAAGLSSRMGRANKLLLDLNGKKIIEHVVGSLCATHTHFSSKGQNPLSEIIVVLGHEAPTIRQALSQYAKQVQFVHNAGYQQGMTSSIQTGLSATSSGSKGYMICLSDLPFIQAATYRQIAQHFLSLYTSDAPLIVRPTWQNKQGHPIVFSHHFQTPILQHTIATGCKAILRHNQQAIRLIELDTPSICQDVDTPKAYQNYLKSIS